MIENSKDQDQDIDPEIGVIEKTRLNFWTLRFSNQYKELEKHFCLTFYNDSLNKVRLAILSAIIFYAFFGILDVKFIPDFKYKFWTIRYVIVIPLLLAVLALSFTRIFKRKIQFISSMVVLFSGIGVIALIWLAPPDLSNYYIFGLVLILIMNYSLFRLRFMWASFSGTVITGLYILAAFEYIQMPYLLCIFNSFFLITINIVGIYVSREFEIYARRVYLSNQLLKIERMKLKTLNARLEAKIKDKTNQMSQLQKEILDDISNEKNE